MAAPSSTFDVDAEGWTAAGDFAGPVTWMAAGGNPAGHVQIADSATGGVTYFVAPGNFVGNHSGSYATPLKFDLRQVYSGGDNQFDDVDVLLAGGGLTLVLDASPNPPNGAWASYEVSLEENAGWRVGTLAGPPPTQAQMQAVLANVTDLRIRAEYQTGPDTGSLDNVYLPEPGSLLSVTCGLIGVASLALRRIRTSSEP